MQGLGSQTLLLLYKVYRVKRGLSPACRVHSFTLRCKPSKLGLLLFLFSMHPATRCLTLATRSGFVFGLRSHPLTLDPRLIPAWRGSSAPPPCPPRTTAGSVWASRPLILYATFSGGADLFASGLQLCPCRLDGDTTGEPRKVWRLCIKKVFL